MKPRPQDVARLLSRLDPGTNAALIFGPDRGLVAERAQRIAAQIVPDGSALQRTDISADMLEREPSAAHDALAEANLFGGRTLVWVEDANEKAGAALVHALDQDLPGFLLVTAGDLKASSGLRKSFEAARNALAIACYADNEAAKRELILSMLLEAGLKAAPDALGYLVENLGADRRLSRGELEKLILYMASADTRLVTLDDARAAVADAAGLALDDIAAAALAGDGALADRHYQRALAQGDSPVAVVRVLLRRLARLTQLRAMMAGGVSLEQAIGRLKPPVFWADKPKVQAEAERWPPRLLGRAMALALEAEIESKTTGVPAEAAVGRLLLRLAQAARHG